MFRYSEDAPRDDRELSCSRAEPRLNTAVCCAPPRMAGQSSGRQLSGRLSPPAQLAEIRRARTAAKLVLRKTHDLSSQKVRDIPAGSRILVLDQMTGEDGCVRARVGIDSSPRGVAVHVLGWVTSLKDGEDKLISADAAGCDDIVDSMAARIAARRQSQARDRAKQLAANEEARGDAPSGHGGEASSSGAGKPAAPDVPAKKKAPAVFMNRGQLLEVAKQLRDQAEAEAGKKFDTLTSKLGNLLNQKGVKVGALVTEWDRNKDGDISKTEFRINVRKLGMTDDVHDIDKLYDELDESGDGSLDLGELRVALKKLQDDAGAAAKQGALVQEHAAGLLKVAEAFDLAAVDAEKVEMAEVQLERMKNNRSAASRLGALLTSRNVKIGDVVRQWDKDGDGSVDPKEFRTHLIKLGFKAEVHTEREQHPPHPLAFCYRAVLYALYVPSSDPGCSRDYLVDVAAAAGGDGRGLQRDRR